MFNLRKRFLKMLKFFILSWWTWKKLRLSDFPTVLRSLYPLLWIHFHNICVCLTGKTVKTIINVKFKSSRLRNPFYNQMCRQIRNFKEIMILSKFWQIFQFLVVLAFDWMLYLLKLTDSQLVDIDICKFS